MKELVKVTKHLGGADSLSGRRVKFNIVVSCEDVNEDGGTASSSSGRSTPVRSSVSRSTSSGIANMVRFDVLSS